MRWRALGALVLCSVAACPSPRGGGGGGGDAKAKEISLFFTAELRGEIEPCGCTSDPLGDLARLAALLADARKSRAVLWFDGGSTLYSEAPLGEGKQVQEQLRADLIVEELPKMGLSAAGLGPLDLGDGAARVRLPRQAANLGKDAGVPLEAPRVIEVDGVKVGVFGVVSPEAVAALGVKAGEAAAAASEAVKALRGQGAQVVVCLAGMTRAEARKLAREVAGIDLLLVGRDAPDPSKKPALMPVEAVGTTFLLQAYQRGQSVLRVDLTVDAGGGVLVDAMGAGRAGTRITELEADATLLREKLLAWEQDQAADKAFVDGKRQELTVIEAEIAELRAQPLRKPKKGSFFVAENLLVKKALRCDAAIIKRKRQLDAAIGAKNLEAAKHETPPEVRPGQLAYVGSEECGFCHAKQVHFWKGTKHAHAWETLETLGKQLDRYCVSCHVTGWRQPGGAMLVGNETMRDVQCEMCHGPGSLHVERDGKAIDTLVRLPPATTCVQCHAPEHSDTFDYKAYLRDVTGPGHGEDQRKKLGDGPTGHELRTAALMKAGSTIGEGCDR